MPAMHTNNEAILLMQNRQGRQLRLGNDCWCPNCRLVEIGFLTATVLDDPENPQNAVMTRDLVQYIYNLARREDG